MRQTTPQFHIGLIANSLNNILHYREPLVQMWESMGFCVTLMAPRPLEEILLPEAWAQRSWIWLEQMDSYSSHPISLLRGIREIRQVIRAQKFNQIYTFTIKPNIITPIAARRLGIPVIPTVTGLGYLEIKRNWKSWLTDMLYQIAMRPLPIVIFHNANDRELFEKRRIIRPGHGRVIPGSGVDTAYYGLQERRPDADFTILYLGRFLEDKGLRDLVIAFKSFRAQVPSARLWMAGDQQSQNPSRILPEEIKSWNDEPGITCLEKVNDVRQLISSASVVILPSWREGMPRAILEAMSMGCPVVVTDVPGCRQAVEHKVTGWVLARSDIQAMTQTLIHVYQMSDEERFQIGVAGRKRVGQNFSNQVILDAYQELLQVEA